MYSLPLLSSAFEPLHGVTIFSKLDLRNAYQLVRIREGDEWKTTFNSLSGMLNTNNTAIFQALVKIHHSSLYKGCSTQVEDSEQEIGEIISVCWTGLKDSKSFAGGYTVFKFFCHENNSKPLLQHTIVICVSVILLLVNFAIVLNRN